MPTIDGGGRDQRIKEALEKKVICRRCQVEMVPKSTFFDYLGHNFHTEILCCPKCGEVYLPEALVKGVWRMWRESWKISRYKYDS